ncbi:MAG: preprotein translocase subunit SecG [Chloroflexota bacterium]
MTGIYAAEIIISLVLIGIVLLQAKGAHGARGLFGGTESGGFRTRRGLEQTIFRLTIILAVLYVAVSTVSTSMG